MLDHPAGDFPGVDAQGGAMATEQFCSVIGTLFPIALCGRTSLSSLRHEKGYHNAAKPRKTAAVENTLNY